jgi:hypothetical protein
MFGFVLAEEEQGWRFPRLLLNRQVHGILTGMDYMMSASLLWGTDSRVADSDRDGIDDATEVKLGLNPLGDSQVATGVIASADTPGIAVDVSAVNNVVAVADSDAGVSIYDVRSITPILMARVDTPGTAQRVAWDGTTLAVADGNGGLAIIDVRVAERAAITHQLQLGNATAVAAAANLAYVGFEAGVLSVVDMSSGSVLRQVSLGEPVRDLVFGGDYLYALTTTKLVCHRCARWRFEACAVPLLRRCSQRQTLV